jgi:hypothetical protein
MEEKNQLLIEETQETINQLIRVTESIKYAIPNEAPSTEGQMKITINEKAIIQSLEIFFQIKVTEIRQENIDNLNETIHTIDPIVQNLLEFSDTVIRRFEEINQAQANLLSRIDTGITETERLRTDIIEIPTLIIEPLVERLALPLEDANGIILSNLEGMMLLIDRIPEILTSLQAMNNFEALIKSPITTRCPQYLKEHHNKKQMQLENLLYSINQH